MKSRHQSRGRCVEAPRQPSARDKRTPIALLVRCRTSPAIEQDGAPRPVPRYQRTANCLNSKLARQNSLARAPLGQLSHSRPRYRTHHSLKPITFRKFVMTRYVLAGLAVLALAGATFAGTEVTELKVDVESVPEGCTTKSKHGDMLTMHYTGTLDNGHKFDSRLVLTMFFDAKLKVFY